MTEDRVEPSSQNPPPTPQMKSEKGPSRSQSLSAWTPSKRFRISMFKGRFCCCFSLQAGVCMYSAMGLVLMISTIILNIGAELHELDRGVNLITQFLILYTHVLSMTAGFVLTYFGAVKPSLRCLKIGNWIVCIFSISWFIISILSFIDDPNITHSVCTNRRCPETLWLVKTYFRVYGNDCDDEEDILLEDEDLNEDDGEKEVKDGEQNYKIRNRTIELGETGVLEDPEGSTISLDEPLVNSYDYGVDENESGSNGNMEEKSNAMNGTTPKPMKPKQPEVLQKKALPKKPDGLEGLELISFESRLIGCTSNPGLYRALSIVAMIFWTLFLVHGILGAFLLIREVNKMVDSGEINRALTHLSYTQERQPQTLM